jgi:hypothetical protein
LIARFDEFSIPMASGIHVRQSIGQSK